MASMLRILRLLLVSLVAVSWRRRRLGPRRPTWSFRFEVVIAAMRRDMDTRAGWPVPRIRKHMSRLPVPRGAWRKVRRYRVTVGERVGLWMTADRKRSPERFIDGDVLLYFHGGSYQYGSVSDTHADIMARLALATGVPVLGVDYRLAPEHIYPAQLEDAVAAYEWLLAAGVPAARIILAGDSAGGNLAVALLLFLRDNRRELPCAAALISPWLDFLCQRKSMERNAGYDFVTGPILRTQAGVYAGEIAPGDARISVINADLSGLPPLLVQVGGAEVMEDECHEFAARARAAGTSVELDVLVDMPHVGPVFAAFAEEGARAIERAATFMAGAWHTGRAKAPRPLEFAHVAIENEVRE